MSALPSFDDISANLEFLDDWEDRYRYLIELGNMLPAFPESEKTAENKVNGCVSQVWLTVSETGNGDDKVLQFAGDSDAMIVKGLVAVLIALETGHTPSEIVATDPIATMDQLGLREHLTTQRSNGLIAMVKRIHEEAQARL